MRPGWPSLLVPLVVLAFVTVVIGGIGILLLALADVKEELVGMREPWSVIGALIIAVAILGISSLLANGGAKRTGGNSR
ncbi:MAG: hypothetical protein HYY31_04625 [Chloroflexi bacterium]|nr:hypothetical protein [Chloroflexota bacterium]